MTETKEEDDCQTVDKQNHQKRKSDLECIGGEKEEMTKKKKIDELQEDGNSEEEEEREVAKAVDKGKGKMIMVEEEEEEEDSDSDSDSDDSGGFVGGEGGDDDSDFSDDPLAEVDLDNILPVRTRRRSPVEPGAYLVADQDEDEDDEDEDGDGE